eukprot:CAMPEP_0119014442 /NCGR_PEP_ID=MMETSP1176-20130426/9743_1 /TAXON_ID=265551 /ORGANISM="Synedropsis recta cf, Strain CCMP1620" /LENGTH=261 /DNA_ID=CAMNT_0006967621 /DNA_START=118 /DNA_END=900 /DNA_ORIENTATION=+
MGKKDHPQSSAGILSRIRRTFLRNAPTTMLQEMRPMLNRNAKAREEAERSKGKARTSFLAEDDVKSSLAIKDGKDAFEFSVRDHSDATAKRGFRVQVPKRIICYTVIVFFVLPIFLFVYVEMHKHSLKKQAARYHTFDITKVLPHLLDDILPDDEGNSTAFADGDAELAGKSDVEESSENAIKFEAKTESEEPGSAVHTDGTNPVLLYDPETSSNAGGLTWNASVFSKLAANATAALIEEETELESESKGTAEAESGTRGR